MILLFQGGPIDGLQIEQDYLPIKFTGATTHMQFGSFKDSQGVIREYDDYNDPQHSQFCYRQDVYVMNAAGKMKAVIYKWQEH